MLERVAGALYINSKPVILNCGQFCHVVSLTDNSLFVFPGMDEAIEHLERLNEYNFHLPEDLAIRHLTKINDAFGES